MNREDRPPNLQAILEHDEFLAVANVRRDVWTGGFKGLFFGSCAGTLGYFCCRYYRAFGVNRRHAIPVVAACGALSSFLGAFANGVTYSDHYNMPRVYEYHVVRQREKNMTRGERRERAEFFSQEKYYENQRENPSGAAGRSRTWSEVREDYRGRGVENPK